MALKSTKFIFISECSMYILILITFFIFEVLRNYPSYRFLNQTENTLGLLFCELTRSFVQGTNQIMSLG